MTVGECGIAKCRMRAHAQMNDYKLVLLHNARITTHIGVEPALGIGLQHYVISYREREREREKERERETDRINVRPIHALKIALRCYTR